MKIEKDVLLKDKNWFYTGGYTNFFCRPTTPKEFVQAVLFAKKRNLTVEILGEGANVLISDDGYNGLIISPFLNTISIEGGTSIVTVGAGRTIQNTIDWCLDNGITGLEEFSGIPGTIGGAVYINIHYFQFFLSNFLIKAQVLDRVTDEIVCVDKNWFEFGYDTSKLQEKRHILISATFALNRSNTLDVAYAQGRRDEIIRQRNSRYPMARTCGSFFKNFDENIATGKPPFVAYYLDKLGIKGDLRFGDAIVSHRHANMIVNQGNATSQDIITLARKMQELVFDNFGLIPQTECQLIGFTKFPLHTEKTLIARSRPAKYDLDTQPLTEP